MLINKNKWMLLYIFITKCYKATTIGRDMIALRGVKITRTQKYFGIGLLVQRRKEFQKYAIRFKNKK